MIRLVELSRVVREAVPGELVPAFWVVTALGSPTILLGVLWFAYWNWDGRRREMLELVGVAFVALALTLLLKEWFALPRPPAEVQRYPIGPAGYGFPSGHAVSSTVVYGGALAVTGSLDRPRLAVPGIAWVLLIGLSRVVLGVHYLGDVLVGFALGVLVLVALLVVTRHHPRRLFGIAAAITLVAFLVGGRPPDDGALALGGSVGALAALYYLSVEDDDHRFRARHERIAYSAVGVAAVAGALAVAQFVHLELAVGLVLFTGLGFAVVALPTVPRRVEGRFGAGGST